MAVVAAMGLFLSLQRRRKPPAELVRGKSLRYRKRLLCYNESRSGNRSKSKGGEPFMANDNGSLSHTKWNCKYHIVFAPKYRRQVVYRQIKADIGRIIRQLCEMKKVEIIKAEACPDHIHMLVSIPPNISVSQFVGYLKGKSSLMIFDRHVNLKYKYGNRHFWCRGYYGDHQRRSVNQNASRVALAAGASESLRFSSNSLMLPLRVHSLTITSALHPLLSGARSMPVYYLLAGKRFLHTADFEKT